MIDVPVDYRPDRALHPGKVLQEELAARDMTQREFAKRMHRPPQVINQIIRGKKAITPETALAIEKVLGIDAQFWVNLQRIYDLVVARMAEDEELELQKEWLRRFPVAEMTKLGWLDEQRRVSARLRELLKFLGVPSFDALEPSAEAIGFRITEKARVDEWALRAWLRQGERVAINRPTLPYDPEKFKAAVAEIRQLTNDGPEVYWPRMRELCADAGVVVIGVPHLRNTGANGVARWLSPRKAMIQVNLRYAWADIFWFTFFHEAAHVMQHDTKRIFVDLKNDERCDPAETRANFFSSDTLIPPIRYQRFVEGEMFTLPAVQSFADEIDIHPGIVVGRLQHDGHVRRDRLNSLRERLKFERVAAARD